MEIYCPKCEWKPDASSLWGCTCGCVWNTFDTQGVCPKCKHVWHDTQCLACHKWSKHHDWYHDFPSVDIFVEELEPKKETV